jgi:hypothetical protein
VGHSGKFSGTEFFGVTLALTTTEDANPHILATLDKFQDNKIN